MKKMVNDDLPLILVSAAASEAADTIITELIDNEPVVEDMANGVASAKGMANGVASAGHIWILNNKYYTASVKLQAVPDDAPASTNTSSQETAPEPEAHIVHLAVNECNGADVLERRAQACEQDGDCAVRLALCACERDNTAPALVRAADMLGYELVWLQESDPGGSGPFPERRGLSRAREALHAHTWPNLRLHRPSVPITPALTRGMDTQDDFSEFQSFQETEGSPGSPGNNSDSDPDEAECVRRAELFADVLGALQGVREGARGELEAEGGRGERVLRAEQMVEAFCRALGTDIDEL